MMMVMARKYLCTHWMQFYCVLRTKGNRMIDMRCKYRRWVGIVGGSVTNN
jgi:hypothetical protein